MNQNPNALSFLDHLDEFRSRAIKIALVAMLCCFCVYPFIDRVLAFIIKPVGKIVFTSPAEGFIAHMTLTILCGILISIPFLFFQIWQFVAVGLKENEMKYIMLLAPISSLLFFLGGAFAYFIALPISIKFLLGFSTPSMLPMITIKSYLSFIGTLVLGLGIVFELPLVLFFLTKIGIATPAFLQQKRRYAVVLILVLCAIITPPDVITQLIMAAPLIILYEIGILVSRWTYSKNT